MIKLSKAAPLKLKLRRSVKPLPAPERPIRERARLPAHWQKDLAGVTLTRPKGPGQRALDALCDAQGWTWGVVSTYLRKEDGTVFQCTSVLVGIIVEGAAEHSLEPDEAKCWDEHDHALARVAERLEQEHGG